MCYFYYPAFIVKGNEQFSGPVRGLNQEARYKGIKSGSRDTGLRRKELIEFCLPSKGATVY